MHVGGIAGAAAQLDGGGQPDEPRPGEPGPVRQVAQRRLAERGHSPQVVKQTAGEAVPTRPEHEAEQFGAGQGPRAVLEEPVGGRVGRDAPAARGDPRWVAGGLSAQGSDNGGPADNGRIRQAGGRQRWRKTRAVEHAPVIHGA